MIYTVEQGLKAIAIRSNVDWVKNNFKVIATKRQTVFNSASVIFQPDVPGCNHDSKNAQVIGAAYAICGFYGFIQGDWILIIPTESVGVSHAHEENA